MKNNLLKILMAAISILLTKNAFAEYYKVYEPIVVEGEKALELNNAVSADKVEDKNGYVNQIVGFEQGVNEKWKYELTVELERDAGLNETKKLTNYKFENVFTPYRTGELWCDLGYYLEVEKAAKENIVNFETKLLAEKDIVTGTSLVANLGLSHQTGPDSAEGIFGAYAFQLKHRLNKYFQPGIEYYVSLNRIDTHVDGAETTGQVGLVAQGKFGKLLYDGGVLVGTNDTSFERVYKINFEYEF